MKKYSIIFLTLAIFLPAVSYRTPAPSSKHFTIQQLAPGVWAAINNDYYGHAICNAGIIDLGDKTIIFDPFMNIDAANDLKAAATQLTHKPVSIVINSHYHNDHIRGDQVFLPATIISTEWTRNEIAISEPEELAWEKENAAQRLATNRKQLQTATGKEKDELPMWIGYYEGMLATDPIIKTTLPNITFSDSMWIYGTVRNIKLVECKNGHTASDAVLIIPKDSIAFMGDILFVKRHPWLGDGDPQSWGNHLKDFYNDHSLKQFVPGHGPVGGKAEVNELRQYMLDLQQLVSEEIQQQKPDSVIEKTSVPAPYADWKFERFYVPNLDFLCKELRK